jgi:hypothetical protein
MPECRGPFSDINRHIEDFAPDALNQFALCMRILLVMEAAQHATDRV